MPISSQNIEYFDSTWEYEKRPSIFGSRKSLHIEINQENGHVIIQSVAQNGLKHFLSSLLENLTLKWLSFRFLYDFKDISEVKFKIEHPSSNAIQNQIQVLCQQEKDLIHESLTTPSLSLEEMKDNIILKLKTIEILSSDPAITKAFETFQTNLQRTLANFVNETTKTSSPTKRLSMFTEAILKTANHETIVIDEILDIQETDVSTLIESEEAAQIEEVDVRNIKQSKAAMTPVERQGALSIIDRLKEASKGQPIKPKLTKPVYSLKYEILLQQVRDKIAYLKAEGWHDQASVLEKLLDQSYDTPIKHIKVLIPALAKTQSLTKSTEIDTLRDQFIEEVRNKIKASQELYDYLIHDLLTQPGMDLLPEAWINEINRILLQEIVQPLSAVGVSFSYKNELDNATVKKTIDTDFLTADEYDKWSEAVHQVHDQVYEIFLSLHLDEVAIAVNSYTKSRHQAEGKIRELSQSSLSLAQVIAVETLEQLITAYDQKIQELVPGIRSGNDMEKYAELLDKGKSALEAAVKKAN